MSLHEELAVEGPINCLLKCLSYKKYPAKTHLEPKSLPGCHFCYKLSSLIDKGYQEASLTAVRQKILDIYPSIFQCQIWDLKMGRPVLERTFIRNVQLEPFTYICHVSYFVNRWAMEIACSNFSVCNIAIITAIRYLEVSLGHRLQWEPPIDLKPAVIPHLKAERTVKVEELLEDLLERNMVLRLTEELRRKVNVNLETVLKRFKELEAAGNLQKQRDLQQEKEPEWKLRKLESKLISLMKMQKDLNAELMLIQERHVRIIEKVNLEMLQNIILETKIELKEKRRMKLERRTSGLELESDLKDEIVFLLRSKRVLNLDKVFIRECMAQHLEPKLKEELKMLTEQERVLEHELIERNRGLEIDQQELSLKQGLKLPVDQILQREPPMDLKPAQIPRLEGDRTDKVEELLEDLLERDMVLGLTEELKRKVNLSIESVLRRIKELENMTVEHKVKSIVKTKCELKDELQWLIQLEESWQREELCEQRKLQQEKLLYEVKSKVKQVMDLRKKLNAELGHESMYEIVFLVRLKWVLNLEVAFIRECMAELGEKLSLEVKHLEPKLREEVELLLQRERVPEYELIGRNRGLQIDQPEVKLKQGLKLPVDRVHELQNKIACLEEIKRILETGHRRQELDQEESNLKQKLEFLLERERGSRHEMQYRDYQVLKFVLDQERRWKGELQEREENPVAFVNLEQELGREWIAETWKTWTWLSKCERGLTSTEFAWVRNRFHELKQLEVNLTAEEELESLLIKEGRMYDELTSDRVTEFDRTMERIFRDFELPQIYRTTEELGHLFACRQLFSSQFWEDWRLCLPGSKQSEIEESKKKNLETLQERKRELMHEMEMELNRKRDHEVKGAQCWTAWVENELMPKGIENLMMKKYRWLRLDMLTKRRWKGELQEREENPVAFLIERNRELEHERRDVHVNLEQELGREWIAETWKTWTLLSKCERELTSTEFAWVRNRFHELDQLDVNLTAEEELESLLIKEGRLYDELTSDSEPN
ncbi:trichohyalin-like, partial [Stylophora pistillata]|uniref:trichohyalin-like n=1 Tax=Stylophora pistillata TaxID=50429 RepID=UPI000C042F82